MAFHCFCKRGHRQKVSDVEDVQTELKISNIEDVQLQTNWEDVTCPICLDYPHNSVLLQCSSYDKGCRPFVCDTNHLHSNCLERFKTAYGVPSVSKPPLMSEAVSAENFESVTSESDCKPTCPLCRGEVNGWVIIEKARLYLDQKTRFCAEEHCTFVGTYLELMKHAQQQHPNSCPSRIDSARKVDWENFQQSSEIIDVLSTIHSEVPRGVVLGDYVIEYGDDDIAAECDDFPGDEGNWWTSCILYQVFDNLRSSRNRRRSRPSDTRRGTRRRSHDISNSDDGSTTSLEFTEYRGDDTDDEFVSSRGPSRPTAAHPSSRRRSSRIYDQ
ncbi:hypothetical protein Ancab_001810 [Ancistrocladus abbreviatus]